MAAGHQHSLCLACPCLSSRNSPCTRSPRCPHSLEPSTPQCHGTGSGSQAANCGPARGRRSLPSLTLPYHHHALIFFPLIFPIWLEPYYNPPSISIYLLLGPSLTPFQLRPLPSPPPTPYPSTLLPIFFFYLGADTSVPPSPHHHQLVGLPGGWEALLS